MTHKSTFIYDANGDYRSGLSFCEGWVQQTPELMREYEGKIKCFMRESGVKLGMQHEYYMSRLNLLNPLTTDEIMHVVDTCIYKGSDLELTGTDEEGEAHASFTFSQERRNGYRREDILHGRSFVRFRLTIEGDSFDLVACLYSKLSDKWVEAKQV